MSDTHKPTWKQAHQELTRLARARAALEHEEAAWLLVAHRENAHVHLGQR